MKKNISISDSSILPVTMKHNFWTWSAQAKVTPIPVVKADGVYFWDADGKRYLDFNSMVMCSNIGHNNRHVIDAICNQANTLAFAGPKMATAPRAILGEKLAEITPGNLNHFLYTLGGADANENAIKFARAFTGKHKILARYRSYHGATHGAIALTGDPRRHAWEPLVMPGVVHFLDPYRYRSTFHRTTPDIPETEFTRDYLNHLEEIIHYEGDDIAAIILEPVTGTNGIIVPPQGYIQGVREICDKHRILLIADEVMTGFGRTGEWFAMNNWGVTPDIITMAKGLTSGYAPLGAVAIKDEIAAYFDEKPFIGGLTYNGHPISLAAAIANIEVLKEQALIPRAKAMGAIMRKHMMKLAKDHPSVGDIRSIGLFGAVELVRNRETREPFAPFNGHSQEMELLQKFLLDHGVFLYNHWNILLLIPPLIISEAQMEEGFAIIDDALKITDSAMHP